MNLKKSYCFIFIIGVFICFFFAITGCGDLANEIVETRIPDTTKVLSTDSIRGVMRIEARGAGTGTSAGRDTGLSFDSSSAEIQDLAPGDIIVSDACPELPMGMLRRVISKRTENGRIILETEQAKLEEAIESCQVSFTQILTPEEYAVLAFGRTGVDLASVNVGIEQYFLGNQLKIYGNINLTPTLNFNLTIVNHVLTDMELYISFTETATLGFDANIEMNVEKEMEICKKKFGPYSFAIGPIPIVIGPEIILKAGFEGTLTTSTSAEIMQQAGLSLGVKCENGIWNPIANVSNEFSFRPPELSANLNAVVYGGVRINIWLYELLVPWFEPRIYVELDANYGESPLWHLYAGIDGSLGVDLGNFLTQETAELISFNKVIDLKFEILNEHSFNNPEIPLAPLYFLTTPDISTCMNLDSVKREPAYPDGYISGSIVQVKAEDSYNCGSGGYTVTNVFDHWADENGNYITNDNPAQVTMDRNRFYQAIYRTSGTTPVPPPSYSFSATADVGCGGCYISKSPSGAYFSLGDVVTLSAPNEYTCGSMYYSTQYYFTHWTDTQGNTVYGRQITVKVDENENYIARYSSSDQCTLSTSSVYACGTVYPSRSPNQSTYDRGSSVKISVPSTRACGNMGYYTRYTFSHWIDGTGAAHYGNPLTVTMDRNKSFRPVYR